jgi:hypothetical protein
VEAGPGWYGNRVFILDPRPEDVDRLREIMTTIRGDSAAKATPLVRRG